MNYFFLNYCDSRMESLSYDSIYYICQNLCIVDRVSLKFSCKTLYEYVDDLDITPFIKSRIKYVPNLLDYINSETIISGSFILACLYDTYDFNDIDIYENHHTVNNIVKAAISAGRYEDHSFYKNYDNKEHIDEILVEGVHISMDAFQQYSKLTKYLFDSAKNGFCTNRLVPLRDKWVVNNILVPSYHAKHLEFQRILIPEDIKKCIFFGYDINLLCNYFDGELHVKSWDCLINKASDMKPNYDVIECYYGEFFEIDYDESLIEVVNDHMEKSKERYEKYIARGFDIRPIYAFEESMLEGIYDALDDEHKKMLIKNIDYIKRISPMNGTRELSPIEDMFRVLLLKDSIPITSTHEEWEHIPGWDDSNEWSEDLLLDDGIMMDF